MPCELTASLSVCGCLQVKNRQLEADHDMHPCWSNRADVDLKDVLFDLTGPSLHGVVSHVREEALAAQKARRLPRMAALVSKSSWPWVDLDNVAPASEDWTEAVMKQVASDSSLRADEPQWEEISVDDARGTEAWEVAPEDQKQRRSWLLQQLNPLTLEIVNQIMSGRTSSDEFQRLSDSAVQQMEAIVSKMERGRDMRPITKRATRGKSGRERRYEKTVKRAKQKQKRKSSSAKGTTARREVSRLAVDGVSGNCSEDEVSVGGLGTPRRQSGRDTVPTRTLQQALTEHQDTHGG